MPLRRILVLLAALAAACAPTPEIGQADDPGPDAGPTVPGEPAPPTTSPTQTPPTIPPTPAPPSGPVPSLPFTPPLDLPDPRGGEIADLAGRAVLHDATATIRRGDDALTLEPAELPAQPTWSRDGSRLVLLRGFGAGASLAVFDGMSGEVLAEHPTVRPYFFFTWSHDGTRIAALGPGPDGTTLDILDGDGALLHDDVARAQSLWVSWDPDAPRLAVHADERLLRVDADGAATELGTVGTRFYAPKWIPGTDEILLVVDIEGSDTLVRRGIDGGDPLVPLGSVDTETSIAVNPDGRTAALTILFDEESGGEAAQRTALGPPMAQEGVTRSGQVDIIDLASGERVPVFTGPALWVEWNPPGDRLLIGTSDLASGTAAWSVYAHDDPFADAAAEIDPTVVASVESFAPTQTFLTAYLPFGDQYIEQPRLWSPAGDRFVFSEATSDGGWALSASADEPDDIEKVGPGEVAFWSPVE